MQFKLDWVLDLGNLGERPCVIDASIRPDGYFDSYHLQVKSVTVECFGDMDLSRLLTKQSLSLVEDEVIDAYKMVLDVAKERQQERRSNHGRVAVEAWC